MSISFRLGKWNVHLSSSLEAFGLAVLFHCAGHFGGHIVLGPFALIVEHDNTTKLIKEANS